MHPKAVLCSYAVPNFYGELKIKGSITAIEPLFGDVETNIFLLAAIMLLHLIYTFKNQIFNHIEKI